MTNYTKTMGETLESMYVSEDNIAILRDIVKRKSAMPLKFADGKMKVDLFTASAVTQALDKVKAANKEKITKLINTGKKANFMSVAKVVMKSENDPEIKEEVEVEEVSLLAQQSAILISKRELERNPRKEEVEPDEMNPKKHVGKSKKNPDMFCVFDTNGNEVKLFKDKKDAEEFAVKNHDMLMGRESKKEEVKLDELVPPSRHVGKSEKNPDMFAVYDQKGKEVKLFKDEDDAKEYAVKNHEALMGHDKPKKEEDDLDEAVKVGDNVKVKLSRKGREYIEKGKVTKIEKDSIIVKHDFSRTPSKVKMTDIVKEEADLDEGKMSQLHQHIKDKKSAEEIAKLMKVDVKTIKALMSSHHPEDVEEGAAADARRAMSKDKDLRRSKDSADDDNSATDDDVKAASKNIMMQLRKAQSLGGAGGDPKRRFKVEFGDGKKVEIPVKMAQAITKKFNAQRKPADKEKFQARIGKSYKDVLSALKEELQPKKESILERMNRKIKENKDG